MVANTTHTSRVRKERDRCIQQLLAGHAAIKNPRRKFVQYYLAIALIIFRHAQKFKKSDQPHARALVFVSRFVRL